MDNYNNSPETCSQTERNICGWYNTTEQKEGTSNTVAAKPQTGESSVVSFTEYDDTKMARQKTNVLKFFFLRFFDGNNPMKRQENQESQLLGRSRSQR